MLQTSKARVYRLEQRHTGQTTGKQLKKRKYVSPRVQILGVRRDHWIAAFGFLELWEWLGCTVIGYRPQQSFQPIYSTSGLVKVKLGTPLQSSLFGSSPPHALACGL
uniref:Uncharacterized protein n=1 Tax=Lotharella globosa TaxID=91324 RepID=A0A7S3Z5B9_9EUKA